MTAPRGALLQATPNTQAVGTTPGVGGDWRDLPLPLKQQLLERVQGRLRQFNPYAIPYCPHEPHPKQKEFLNLEGVREALYGGAAGGGKSDALLMAALQYVNEPSYSAILFRRTFSDLALPDALMDRANKWLRGTDARWKDRDHRWVFPSGATITFGHLDSESDKYKYQSAAFHYIGFDELTQFTETQYTYLFSRLRRSSDSRIPLRMRAASNPGGEGHEWVKQRFIVESAVDQGRRFIPARLEDNPSLDAEDYELSLSNLDPVTRAQLRRGDWDITEEGKKFRREWFISTMVDMPPPGCRWVRYWDMAATEPDGKTRKDPDWTVGTLMGLHPKGDFYIPDVQRFRLTPGSVEERIRQVAEQDGYATEIWMEEEPGSAGVTVIDHYTRITLRGFAFRGYKSTGKKEVRANPLATQAESGHVHIVRGGSWISSWLGEVGAYPTKGIHDDQVDSASGALIVLTHSGPAYAPMAEAVTQQSYHTYTPR